MRTRSFLISPVFFAALLVGSPALTFGSADSERLVFWQFLGTPFGDASVKEIVIHPDDDDVWLVGSSNGGLYITRDGGDTWTQHIGGNIGDIPCSAAALVFADNFGSGGVLQFRTTTP